MQSGKIFIRFTKTQPVNLLFDDEFKKIASVVKNIQRFRDWAYLFIILCKREVLWI
jgi:hypothetical protein